MIQTRWVVWMGLGALLLFLALGAANLFLGDLNQDEGWYLYAAGQVAHGKLPYRDFAFTQAPLLPLVYSVFTPLVEKQGVLGGRLVTLFMGLAGAGLASWLAARSVLRKWAATSALLAFVLIAGNVYQSYFTTVVKTYSLCALMLMAGLLFLSFMKSRWGGTACFLSGVLLALAAGTRISAGIALPIVFFYLVVRRKSLASPCWFAFGAGSGLAFGALMIPFLVAAPDGFMFGVFKYHTFRSAGGLISKLVYKGGFLSRFVQAYFVACGLGAGIALARGLKLLKGDAGEGSDRLPKSFNAVLWITGLGISLVHFSANFPYDDYQVFVFPVLAVALAVESVKCLVLAFPQDSGGEIARSRATLWFALLLLLANTAASFSSQMNQGWFIAGQDRIWWRFKPKPALKQLHNLGVWLSEHTKPGDKLFTQDIYIAVEAGLSVPEGLEMGPFAYFPEFTRDRAEKLHVLNREMMIELIRTMDAPFAAISGYSLSIQSPEVKELSASEHEMLINVLQERYEKLNEIRPFGQAHTTLGLFQKKK